MWASIREWYQQEKERAVEQWPRVCGPKSLPPEGKVWVVWLARAQEASSFNTEDTEDTESTEEGYDKGEKIWGMHGRAGADCFRRFDVA